jgi:cytochrome c oxidase cbb3-type subunit 3
MIASVTDGRAETAMRPFRGILGANDIALVVDFIRDAFMRCRDKGTLYHSAANGWPEHRERYGPAYPFVLGQRSVDNGMAASTGEPPGLTLFRESCSICHDPVAVEAMKTSGSSDASAPRFRARWVIPVKPGRPLAAPEAHSDESSEAYETYDAAKRTRHDIPPALSNLTAVEAAGERLYQKVCAYCHAADGSGQNWIGSFLEPHPTDFTARTMAEKHSDDDMRNAILAGVPSTSMPAFRSALDGKDVDAIIAYLKRAFMHGQKGHFQPNRR